MCRLLVLKSESICVQENNTYRKKNYKEQEESREDLILRLVWLLKIFMSFKNKLSRVDDEHVYNQLLTFLYFVC